MAGDYGVLAEDTKLNPVRLSCRKPHVVLEESDTPGSRASSTDEVYETIVNVPLQGERAATAVLMLTVEPQGAEEALQLIAASE